MNAAIPPSKLASVHDFQMVREIIPSGQTLIPKATYLVGPRGPEYRYDHQSQTIRWYRGACPPRRRGDGLGSVLAEVGPAGNLTASRRYDVYGLVRHRRTV